MAKLSSTGAVLLFSTYFGGTEYDIVNDVALDIFGRLHIAGSTSSADFPTTPGAFQRSFGGGDVPPVLLFGGDGFVALLSRSGSSLLYSTYLGGREADRTRSIAVDILGSTYVTGDTRSPDFPTTPGAFQTTFLGGPPGRAFFGGDAYVTKLNGTGTALEYSSFLGGSEEDLGATSGSTCCAASTCRARRARATSRRLRVRFRATLEAGPAPSAPSNFRAGTSSCRASTPQARAFVSRRSWAETATTSTPVSPSDSESPACLPSRSRLS